VIALAIFIVTVFTLGGEKKSFTRKFTARLVFSEINGLKKGNNVWFDGVKIGTVTKIELIAPSKVEVTVNIEKKSQPFIKQNAMAKIGSDGFLGNKIVIIYGGTSDAGRVEDNGYLSAQKDTVSTESMLATLQVSNKNLLEITNNLKDITSQIKNGKGVAGRLINDSMLGGNLRAALIDFRTIAAKGRHSIGNIESFTSRMDERGSSVNKLLADTVLYDSVKLAIIEFKATLQKANDAAQKLNTFSANLAKVSDNLLDTSNTAGMILNDQQTADDIRVIIRNLKSSSKKLDEDLEAMQHSILLKGYFKKNDKNTSSASN
jgi:phospholipid/cholesterol/gamma-HCH transport system substrate-binding protein